MLVLSQCICMFSSLLFAHSGGKGAKSTVSAVWLIWETQSSVPNLSRSVCTLVRRWYQICAFLHMQTFSKSGPSSSRSQFFQVLNRRKLIWCFLKTCCLSSLSSLLSPSRPLTLSAVSLKPSTSFTRKRISLSRLAIQTLLLSKLASWISA